MKYHPITEEEWFTNRDYIGPYWTRKAIRTIQAVLNSTAGKIGKGRTFFFKAFGSNEMEFKELIRMPEAFIIKRWDAELGGLTEKWRKAYNVLNDRERDFADKFIDDNIFEPSTWEQTSAATRKLLNFYLIKRDDIPPSDEYAKIRHIKKFEKSCPHNISKTCKQLLEIRKN
jgi:hypothetical protein